MTDTIEQAATATAAAVTTAGTTAGAEIVTAAANVEADKKAVENTGHNFLYKTLAWLKAEFTALGLDIETELKKL